MEKVAISLIRFYKMYISIILEFLFGRGCKFTPTCSDYALSAIKKFGLRKGFFLSFGRFARCHPFSQGNYFDPVPQIKQ